MPAMRVVPALDEIEHNGRGFALILESMEREQLALQRCVEALAHRIVVAIANGSHRRSNALALAALAKGDRRVLAALVRVMDHVLRPAPEDRHIERFEDEFGAQVVGHSPTDDATTEHVEYDSQVEKAGPRWDVDIVLEIKRQDALAAHIGVVTGARRNRCERVCACTRQARPSSACRAPQDARTRP